MNRIVSNLKNIKPFYDTNDKEKFIIDSKLYSEMISALENSVPLKPLCEWLAANEGNTDKWWERTIRNIPWRY